MNLRFVAGATARAMALLAGGLLAGGCQKPQHVFADATRVEFRRDVHDPARRRAVLLTDPQAVRAVVATLDLHEKVPCACDHTDQAIFQTPSGPIAVGLCPECFDFSGKSYAMPPAFLRAFEAALARAPQKPH